MKIEGLRKNYDVNSGIANIDMHISNGTIHGFLGLNGSGKTTTMKIIMGLLRKDGGIIEYNGENYDPSRVTNRGRIGFSPDLPFYPPYLTGEELLCVYGRIRGFSKSEGQNEALNLLKMVDLQSYRSKKIGRYSRGMLSRLGIAVSLIGEPSMIILDEPTSGLDPAASLTIRNLLSEQRKSGVTILLSSHLLGEIQGICQKVTIIHRGKTLKEGPVKDIMREFNNGQRYIAEFNNLPPPLLSEIKRIEGIDEVSAIEKRMNVIKFRVSSDDDIREIIAKIALKNGAVMVSCTSDEQSLEDLFLKLVGDYDDYRHRITK